MTGQTYPTACINNETCDALGLDVADVMVDVVEINGEQRLYAYAEHPRGGTAALVDAEHHLDSHVFSKLDVPSALKALIESGTSLESYLDFQFCHFPDTWRPQTLEIIDLNGTSDREMKVAVDFGHQIQANGGSYGMRDRGCLVISLPLFDNAELIQKILDMEHSFIKFAAEDISGLQYTKDLRQAARNHAETLWDRAMSHEFGQVKDHTWMQRRLFYKLYERLEGVEDILKAAYLAKSLHLEKDLVRKLAKLSLDLF